VHRGNPDFAEGEGVLDLALLSAHEASSGSNAPAAVDLSVAVGTLRLANPVIAAAGTFGYGLEFAHLVDLNRLGGIVTKGLSLGPIEGAPAPRLCETPCGMMNAVGLQNVGVRAFVAGKLPKLRAYRAAVIANVFGQSVGEYAEVIRILEDAEGLAAYELNISCPNVEQGGSEFGNDPSLAAEVTAAARAVARQRPLWVKLAPTVGRIGVFAKAAEEAGADALTIANTYPALSLDVRTGKSRLGNGIGGLSGPAVKPITVRLVRDARMACRLPIVGLGGVKEAEDVLEYLLAGASAVQVGTAHFIDPRASEQLVARVERLCRGIKCFKINEIKVNQ
jgi:dihydroorotate dehydrogenase (NAD+) catalytic subunit